MRIVNPLDIADWDEQIARLPGSTFFHTSAWARVLSETYDYRPIYFAVFEDNHVTRFLPLMEVRSILTGNRGISLPFTDICDPVACQGNQFRDLIDGAVQYGMGRKWRLLEVRGGQNSLPDVPASKQFLTHSIDLRPDEGHIEARLRDSTKRNIKKSLKQGVSVEISADFASVKDFCSLNCLTRKEHGLPPQPFRFFDAVYKNILAKGHGFVSLARFQEKPIAADMYFHFGNTSMYKYGASDRDHQHLRASNLVMWEGIRHLKSLGIHTLDLGRTELMHQGLRQFKLGWGATEAAVNYIEYDFKKTTFIEHEQKQSDPLYNTVFKHTPIPLLKVAGAIAYRHMA